MQAARTGYSATKKSRPRRPRLTVAHGLMVLAGLVTFLLVATALQDRSATTQVWIAAEDLEAGATVDERRLRLVEVAADDPLLPVLLVGPNPPHGRVRNAVAAGEPLLASHIAPDAEAVASRTSTITVDQAVIDGLGLRVGDTVDVIGRIDGVSVYVVVGVDVARLPGRASGSGLVASSVRNSWVTVEVDDIEALALSEARAAGEIDLVRSTGAEPVAGSRLLGAVSGAGS